MKIGRILDEDDIVTLALVDGETVSMLGPEEKDILAACMRRGAGLRLDGRQFALADANFLPPVARPPSLRDFMAFDAHVRNCVEGSGGTMHPEWGDAPVFYFSNPGAIVGPEAEVRIPKASRSLDYELEVACVIGRDVRDLDPDDPAWSDCIAGFMLMNDWSARDVAAKEMKHGLGPAKGKDFATSIGPWLVTPDELFGDGADRIDLPLTARVNGVVRSSGALGDMHFSWPRLLARASADATLLPGDVIGSGTVGTGCLLELRITQGREANPWLADGDVVELEAPLLGVLRNTVRAAS